MNHERFEELLNLYVDNALDDTQAVELFAHLSSCADCRTQLKTLTTVRAAVRSEQAIPVPASLDARVLGQTDAREKRAPKQFIIPDLWNSRISVPLPAASSFAFLLIVVSLIAAPILFNAPEEQRNPPRAATMQQLQNQFYQKLMTR